jgi:hypothetical protein
MAFWGEAIAELGRNRARLRQAIKPWRASLLEFLVFAAVLLAFWGPFLLNERWALWAPAVALAVVLAVAFWLELRRQKRSAASAEDLPPQRAWIGLALFLALPFATLGAAWATRAPPQTMPPGFEIPEDAPKATSATIVP